MIFFSKVNQYKNISRVIITRNKSTKTIPIIAKAIISSKQEKNSLTSLETMISSCFNLSAKPVELLEYNFYDVIHLFTKSVPYLKISQETYNRTFNQLHRLSQIFSLFYVFMYITQGQAGEEKIRQNIKFKTLLNATISKAFFNQESQLANYISLQIKYIHKEIFSILLKESTLMLDPTALYVNSNFLVKEDFEILQSMCIPIRNIDFLSTNKEKKAKINANYLLNHLISNYKEQQGVYYSFIKAYDNLHKGNLYSQVNNYLKTLSTYFRMYTVLLQLQEAFLKDAPDIANLTEEQLTQINLIKNLAPFYIYGIL